MARLPDMIGIAMLVVIALDWALARWHGRPAYALRTTLGSLACFGTAKLVAILAAPGPMSPEPVAWALVRLDPRSPWMLALCALGVDLAYYAWHRALHRVNALWALHVVHHQPDELNYATGARTGFITQLTSVPFFLPLLALGFPPALVLTFGALLGLYQFFLHDPRWPPLGPLEWLLSTPAQHRVHHACNPAYLDRNYGGVLCVWDRLFGTFAAEREAPRYGLGTPVTGVDPLALNLSYAREQWARARRLDSLVAKLRFWLLPPGAAEWPLSPDAAGGAAAGSRSGCRAG